MENYKINRENKTFVLDSGEEIPIPKDKVKQVLRSPAANKSKQEATEKWKQWEERIPLGDVGHTYLNNTSESVLGNLGDTAANYVVSGIKGFSPGEGQEEMGYVDRVLDHFYAMQEGRKEHLAEQSERNPTAALSGQLTGMGLELGSLYGVPATAALPIMGAGHSETSFLEPGEKLPELAQEAALGYAFDKFFGAAGKVAGHRQTRRGIQNAIRDTEEANLAEISRATQATEADAARFAQETAAREAEIGTIPARQQAANQQFVESGAQRVERVAQTLGKTPIAVEAVGVEPFIEQFIEQSAYSGSKEGGKVANFLRNLFKGKNGKVAGEDIQRGMRAVDESLAKSAGGERDLLTQFKTFVTQELPAKLGNYFAVEKWLPKIQSRIMPVIENDLANVFKNNHESFQYARTHLGNGFLRDFNKSLRADVDAIFAKHAGNFEEGLRSGAINQEITAAIEANPIYQRLVDEVAMTNQFMATMQGVPVKISAPQGFEHVKEAILNYPSKVSEKMTSVAERYLPDISLDVTRKSGITNNTLSKAPTGPQIVAEPPPVNPAQTIQPNLQQVPTMPEPQGLLQRLAYGLESISEGGVKGAMQTAKESIPGGMLAKIAGVPVEKLAAGGAALAVGAGSLTSPSLAGQIGRGVLQQTAIAMDQAQQRAAKYPSHRGMGVLENPMERRSLVKELEDDYNMKLEDKAIIQSKVNRGQPLIPDIK